MSLIAMLIVSLSPTILTGTSAGVLPEPAGKIAACREAQFLADKAYRVRRFLQQPAGCLQPQQLVIPLHRDPFTAGELFAQSVITHIQLFCNGWHSRLGAPIES